MKSQKNNIKDTQGSILLDRDACFKIVAGAVKAVAINSVVDLKSPEVDFYILQLSTFKITRNCYLQ